MVVPEEGSGSSRLLFRYVYFFGGITLLLLAKSQFKSLENHNLQIKSSKKLLMVLNERFIYESINFKEFA